MAKKRPINANDVADWFINRVDRHACEVITPLEVQRLVYFSQAWHLANKGRPLFKDEFEAWGTGPIARSIYDRFESFNYGSIPPIDVAYVITGEKLDLLENIQEQYGIYKGKKLDELSREPGGPWEDARATLPPEAASDTIISKEAMKAFYGKKIGKTWQ